jgi:hypothetical protein
VITFEQARDVAANSPEVLQGLAPGSVEIAEWGHERTAAISSW